MSVSVSMTLPAAAAPGAAGVHRESPASPPRERSPPIGYRL
jgi:hypothetical protein